MARIEDLENNLNVDFKNIALLKEALTHRSYLNEHPDWPLPQNERLEYLGDAVLELTVTERLFEAHPEAQEGTLTSLRAALVNYQMIGRVARELDLEQFLFLSRGEARSQGKAREVILANAMEAVIGAVYLDQGYEAASKLVDRFVLRHLPEVLEKGLYRDPKSLLQELAQDEFKVTPTYRVLGAEGPDHEKHFKMGVFFAERMIAEGDGASKQEAEIHAAEEALVKLKDEQHVHEE